MERRKCSLLMRCGIVAACGEPRGIADILDARSGIAFGADRAQGCIEEKGLRFVPHPGQGHNIPTSWYESRV